MRNAGAASRGDALNKPERLQTVDQLSYPGREVLIGMRILGGGKRLNRTIKRRRLNQHFTQQHRADAVHQVGEARSGMEKDDVIDPTGRSGVHSSGRPATERAVPDAMPTESDVRDGERVPNEARQRSKP